MTFKLTGPLMSASIIVFTGVLFFLLLSVCETAWVWSVEVLAASSPLSSASRKSQYALGKGMKFYLANLSGTTHSEKPVGREISGRRHLMEKLTISFLMQVTSSLQCFAMRKIHRNFNICVFSVLSHLALKYWYVHEAKWLYSCFPFLHLTK